MPFLSLSTYRKSSYINIKKKNVMVCLSALVGTVYLVANTVVLLHSSWICERLNVTMVELSFQSFIKKNPANKMEQ